MEKYPIMTLTLLTLLLISLIVNSALLMVILLYDTFLLTDFITVSAILLLGFGIVGVSMKQKWGTAIIFTKCIFDTVLFFVFLSIGITGTLLIATITLILAAKEYLHVEFYQNQLKAL